MSCDKSSSLITMPKLKYYNGSDYVEFEVETKLVRGGRGNQVITGWNKGCLEEKERDILNTLWYGLSTDSTYDYKPNSKQPKEWSNIEWGRDMLKLRRKDKFILSFIGAVLLNILIYIVIKLVL